MNVWMPGMSSENPDSLMRDKNYKPDHPYKAP